MNISGLFKKTLGTAMLAGALLAAPQAALAHVFVSVGIAPPAIPIYAQPPCPGDGYIWTPGYWAYDEDDGYQWVDGAWVPAPYTGALWTPGYWGWGGGAYFWNAGYWGPTVGYYGGINYGFGYGGVGFYGGYWGGGRFFYNRTYNNININNVHNIYNRPVNGVGVHPGGSGFARQNVSYTGNRGSTINGTHFGNNNVQRGQGQGQGLANNGQRNFGNQNRTNTGGFGNNNGVSNARQNYQARSSFNGGNTANAYNGGAHSFAQSNGGQTYNMNRGYSSASASRPSYGGNQSFGGAGYRGGNQSFGGSNGGFRASNSGGGFHGGGGAHR